MSDGTDNAALIRDRYRGDTALRYEAKRIGAKVWHDEHAAVRAFLSELPTRITVVDIPVGTGRYAEIYAERGITVIGFDTSPEMLKLAREQFDRHGLVRNKRSHLYEHDALESLPDPRGWTYDAIVCTRLYNHFTLTEAQQSLRHLVAAAPVVIYSLRESKVQPITRNWHLMKELESVVNVEHQEIVLEDLDDSRYVMVKLTRTG